VKTIRHGESFKIWKFSCREQRNIVIQWQQTKHLYFYRVAEKIKPVGVQNLICHWVDDKLQGLIASDILLFFFILLYYRDRRGRGSWIYNYLCNQCPSLLMWVRILIKCKCTTLCDKVCQWLATGRCFFPGLPVSSTNKTDRHDIT
jgi:hypothetical protein